MAASRWDRFAAVSGVLFFALWLGGSIVAQLGLPGSDAPPDEVVAYYEDNATEIKRELGSTLVGCAVFFLLVFLGHLRSSLRQAERGRGSLTSASFGGGVAMAVLLLSVAAIDSAVVSADGFFENYEVDANTPIAFSALSFWLGGFALVAAAVLIGATSVVAIKTGFLPKWLAIAGLVLSAIGFFGETAAILIVPILLAALWIAVVSTILFLRSGADIASPQSEAAA